VVKNLQTTLEEEKEADRKLTQVSETQVNKQAA
jgi:ferritin-like metal-binding protein YciE